MTTFRTKPTTSDPQAAGAILRATGMFKEVEIGWAEDMIAQDLDEETDYSFVFADGEDGELLGFSIDGPFEVNPARYDLYWIGVSPKAQGKGIGRTMLAQAEDRARANGCDMMVIETGSLNDSANALYKGAGYKASVVVDYYWDGNNKHTWTKRLDC